MTEAQKPIPIWDRVRVAVRADEPEVMRLFSAMQIEAGISDWDMDKVRAMFDRAFRLDIARLFVVGKPGRLKGMLLFAIVDMWFSRLPQATELFLFVDSGHRRSADARDLQRFAEWFRRNLADHPVCASLAPTGALALPVGDDKPALALDQQQQHCLNAPARAGAAMN